jgi:replicative DNA helicase
MTALAFPASQGLTNTDSEFALLSAILYESKRVETVVDTLREEHFSEPFFGRVYGVVAREFSKGNPLNPLTLRPFIEADESYQMHGAMQFIANLTNSNSLLVNTKATAAQIKELARRRELIAGMREALHMAGDVNETIESVVDAAEAAIVDAADKSDTIRQPSAAQAMSSLLKAAESPKRSIRSTIIPSMDDLLGGMRPKQLIIGGGRPGMGKTAAALSYSLGAAQAGHGVLYVSLEMGAEELAARMAADLAFNGNTGVLYADINSDNPTRRALQAMYDAQKMLEDMPFHIIDAGGLTLAQLELRVRRFKRRFAAKGVTLDLVVVDYLQLLRTDDKRQSAYEAVSEISRRLKGIAKDYDVAVFALAQLSRGVESRSDKRPQLSDLRDSGQIEQDADAVLFFYRHAYYLRQALPSNENDPMYAATMAEIENVEDAIEFVCAKRRNGVTGASVGEFHGKYQAVRG